MTRWKALEMVFPGPIKKRILQHFAVLCLTAAAFFPSNLAVSAEISGRLTSSVYGFEQSDDSHWRPYLGLTSTANLWREGARSFDLHTNLRWTSDFSTKSPRDPQTYVYDLYFELAGIPHGSRLYAGRQFVYSSIGSALIDGIRCKQKLSGSFNLDIYGGVATAHQSPEKIQSLNDNALGGGRLGYQASSETKLGFNWLWRRSDGSTAQHRVGLDGQWLTRRTELYGRAIYDVSALAVSGALARLTVRPDNWNISGEFDWRKPSIDANSIFSMVSSEEHKSVRADVSRKLPAGLTAVGQMHWEFMPGDDSWRTMIGLQSASMMLGWTHRDGYGGKSDGLRGQVTLGIGSRVDAYVSAYFSQYKIQPEPPDRMDAYSSSFGAVWKPGWDTRVRAEGQYFRNAVDDNDWRMFLQIAKNFSIGSQHGEGDR